MKTHFRNHKGRCACNKNFTNVAMSDNWQDLKLNGCGNCKRTEQYGMAKQLSSDPHKYLRQAIANKIDIKLEVTPEQSKAVQEIAFSLGVEWWGLGNQITHTDYTCLFITNSIDNYSITHQECDLKYFKDYKSPQFSFEHDCFVSEINTCPECGIEISDSCKTVGCLTCHGIKQELSACGRTKAEFLAACNDDYSNVYYAYTGGIITWGDNEIRSNDVLIERLDHFGLECYRIKEPEKKEVVYVDDDGNKIISPGKLANGVYSENDFVPLMERISDKQKAKLKKNMDKLKKKFTKKCLKKFAKYNNKKRSGSMKGLISRTLMTLLVYICIGFLIGFYVAYYWQINDNIKHGVMTEKGEWVQGFWLAEDYVKHVK